MAADAYVWFCCRLEEGQADANALLRMAEIACQRDAWVTKLLGNDVCVAPHPTECPRYNPDVYCACTYMLTIEFLALVHAALSINSHRSSMHSVAVQDVQLILDRRASMRH